MRSERLLVTETRYAVGPSIADARYRGTFRDTIQEAWEAVPYYDKQDFMDKLDIYRFETVETVTKIEPPYSQ